MFIQPLNGEAWNIFTQLLLTQHPLIGLVLPGYAVNTFS